MEFMNWLRFAHITPQMRPPLWESIELTRATQGLLRSYSPHLTALRELADATRNIADRTMLIMRGIDEVSRLLHSPTASIMQRVDLLSRQIVRPTLAAYDVASAHIHSFYREYSLVIEEARRSLLASPFSSIGPSLLNSLHHVLEQTVVETSPYSDAQLTEEDLREISSILAEKVDEMRNGVAEDVAARILAHLPKPTTRAQAVARFLLRDLVWWIALQIAWAYVEDPIKEYMRSNPDMSTKKIITKVVHDYNLPKPVVLRGTVSRLPPEQVSVAVRRQPRRDSPRMGVLHRGDVFVIVRKEKDWVLIEQPHLMLGTQRGWVLARYLLALR